MLNAKVASSLSHLLASGALSAADAAALASALASPDGRGSEEGIGALPAAAQELVRAAFQEGTRWAFVSLVPWAAISLIATLFLARISDSDRDAREAAAAAAAATATKEGVEAPKERAAVSEKEVQGVEAAAAAREPSQV